MWIMSLIIVVLLIIIYYMNTLLHKKRSSGWYTYPKHKPTREGRYEVYRKKLKKQHYLAWKGLEWASENDTVTHFRRVRDPHGYTVEML